MSTSMLSIAIAICGAAAAAAPAVMACLRQSVLTGWEWLGKRVCGTDFFSACNGHCSDFSGIPIPQTALNSACSVKHKDVSQDVSRCGSNSLHTNFNATGYTLVTPEKQDFICLAF